MFDRFNARCRSDTTIHSTAVLVFYTEAASHHPALVKSDLLFLITLYIIYGNNYMTIV